MLGRERDKRQKNSKVYFVKINWANELPTVRCTIKNKILKKRINRQKNMKL